MFCSIIGHPLKNPRSIKLWKIFFKKKKLKIDMFGVDVKKSKFKKTIKNFTKNQNFLASAITMPYKKDIVKYVKINDKISSYANSINFILKKNNILYGYNTDVYGALESVKKINNKKNILIYGFGGTGEAIYRTFNKMFNKSKFIIVSSKIKIRLGKRTKHKKTIECKDLFSTDLFINCSPLGSNLKKGFLKKTPLNVNQIKKMKKKSTIFDIIYNPTKTLLSKNCKKLNIKYINGKKMNTLQAKRALNIIESQIKKNND